MAATINLSGRWVGHYRLHGRECPIAAEFIQTGEKLTGFMTDGKPDTETPLAQAVFEMGLPPGADEQIDQRLREMNPGAGRAPIYCVSHLPAKSLLEGTVNGPSLMFIKTYQGASFAGYQVGDKRIGVTRPQHAVQYHGRVSSDGATIEGKWLIPPSQPGERATEGLFLLRREVSSQVQSSGVERTMSRAEPTSWV